MFYSANGKLLATGGHGHISYSMPRQYAEARLWNFDVDENVRYLCATTPRITEEQWRKYVPNLDYDPPCS